MSQGTLRIGVLGAGNWARRAHIPGWQRDGRAHVAVVCDVEPERARELATRFDVPEATDDWQAVVTRPDLDVIDVVTPSQTHFTLASAAIEAGKHVLCEKPVAYDFRQTRWAAELARRRGLKTKLGFTFRYSPGVQYARSLIDEGFTGTPFIFNGYEQNSQWLDPTGASPPGRPHRRPVDASHLLPRRLWRPDHRHRPLVGGRRLRASGRHDAELHPRAGGARHRPDDAHEHRRRRHLHRRVHQRGAGVDPDELRRRRQLPGHRGPALRKPGRHHLPVGRGAGRGRDDQGRHRGRRRVQRAADPRPLLPGRRASRASRGARCSTPT